MNRYLILFLQAFIVLLGLIALAILIRFPVIEGRAENLDLLSIYADPFILYGYATSILFFVGLYQALKLLGYAKQHKLYSLNSIKAVRVIKYCAIIFSISILAAGLYIKIFYNKDDDPNGFLVVSFVIILISSGVAFAMSGFEKKLKGI